jgi:hypothetical protein
MINVPSADVMLEYDCGVLSSVRINSTRAPDIGSPPPAFRTTPWIVATGAGA